MGKLMKSISGIRGVVGDTMTPELILQTAYGFARYVKSGKVVIGRDGRPTGETISELMEASLQMLGCDVIDLGTVPTPTVQIMVEELGAAGGIVISASHNPIEWNAFKLINSDGTFLNSVQIKKFFSFCEMPPLLKKYDRMGKKYFEDRAFSVHINKVLDIIDVKNIRKNKFKVVLDSVNGSGSYITRELFEKLNCEVIPLYCETNGTFPRIAEPLPENLGDLSKAVIRHKADIGFAQDPDADRLAIVDENGIPIGEEKTISLVAEHLLSREVGRVVVNLSTTKIVEKVAEKYNAPFTRSKVGEINVVDEMRKKGARIGGEGNGGVISPEVHLGRDSLVGIGYVLDMMSIRKKTVSQLVSDLPSYFMKKGKVSFNPSRIEKIYSGVKKTYLKEKISELDGIRIDFEKDSHFAGGWVHLRPSNTEPVFRIICEGVTEKQMKEIYVFFDKLIKTFK
ncbi:MAG: phosphoglucosamine mutase [Spirochaetes bacterium]|nr:phosphoglucosamine mutase [Spirochaetota bacterium]